MSVVAVWKKMSLLNKLLIAMIIGIIAGAIVGKDILVIRPLGKIFLDLLRMAALPLIICNLIAGVSSVSDARVFGRCGGKILLYYFTTTLFAATVGLLIAGVIKPGDGFILSGEYTGAVGGQVPSVVSALMGMIPNNIFASLAKGGYDHAVVFSIFMGVAIVIMPADKREKLHNAFELLSQCFGYMIKIIMIYAPIGVGALIACCVGEYGTMFFTFAVKFLAVNYISVFVMVGVYLALLAIFSRRSPLAVVKAAMPAMVMAFSTQSSAATLPVNIQCADNLGLRKSVSGFTLPLGCQINKDGTAILLAASFLFAAQAVGVPLDLGTYIKVVVLALLLTTGSNVVAGGAIVVVTILIESFNLPVETVVVVAGALALIDGILTMGNTLGDFIGTVIVSDSEDKREAAEAAAEAKC